MLGRKPHHAALGTPVLGKVHPCYLGNSHSLGGPGTTAKGKEPPPATVRAAGFGGCLSPLHGVEEAAQLLWKP